MYYNNNGRISWFSLDIKGESIKLLLDKIYQYNKYTVSKYLSISTLYRIFILEHKEGRTEQKI